MAKKKSSALVRWQPAAPAEQSRRGPGWGPYLAPWVTCAGMVPLGFVAHWWWGNAGFATGLAVAAITAAGSVVTLVDHHLTRARTWWAHSVSTTSVAAATVWLATSVALGPGRPVLDGLLIAGAALATCSNLHTWAAGQGSGDGEDDDEAPKGGTAAGLPKLPQWSDVCRWVGLSGVKLKITARSATRTKGRLRVEPGQTVDDVTSATKELASAYGVAPDAIRVEASRTDARTADLTIIHRDVMDELIPWPGLDPAHSGSSIADHPLTLGVYEDGEPYTDHMINDAGTSQTLTMGMSGSGKSVHGKTKVVQVAARKDTFTIAVDMSKGKQTLLPIQGALGWYALNDRSQAKAVLAALKRAIQARGDYLGDHGYAQWVPGCGLTFIYVLLEEAADLEELSVLVELIRTARSTGVHFDVSLQRAHWGQLDTNVRAQLGDGVCFGVRDAEDADFCLPEHVTEAGADPSSWGKRSPGAAYAAVEHQPVERWATPVKMYGPPSTNAAEENRLLSEAAASCGDQDARLDPVTRKAFGKAYAAFVAGRTAVAPASGSVTVTEIPTPEIESDEDDSDMIENDLGDFEVFDSPDPDPSIEGDLDDDLEPPVVDVRFTAPKGSRESAEQARQALRTLLDRWAEKGQLEFRAPDLGRALSEEMGVKRSRQWVIGELKSLAEADAVLHNEDGTFTLTALAGV